MPRINNTTIYPFDELVTENDFLLGSDWDNNSKTKNFPIYKIAQYIKSYLEISEGNRVISIGDVESEDNKIILRVASTGNTVFINDNFYTKFEEDTFEFTPLQNGGIKVLILYALPNEQIFYLAEGRESLEAIEPDLPNNALYVKRIIVSTEGVNIDDVIKSLIFPNDIYVSLPAGHTFGKYKNGDLILSAGKNPTQVIIEALSVVMNPTLNNPSASLSMDTSTREVGSNYTITCTVNYDRGSIVGTKVGNFWQQNVFQNYLAGYATSYKISNTELFPNNSLQISGKTALGSNSFSGLVSYSVGNQAVNSNNEPYGTPLPSGTFNVSNSFKGMYKIFYGVGAEDLTNYRSLSSVFSNASSFILSTGTTSRAFYIVVPNGKKVTKIWDSKINFDIISSFNVSNVVVKDAGDSDVQYKLYKMLNDETYAENHDLQITIG